MKFNGADGLWPITNKLFHSINASKHKRIPFLFNSFHSFLVLLCLNEWKIVCCGGALVFLFGWLPWRRAPHHNQPKSKPSAPPALSLSLLLFRFFNKSEREEQKDIPFDLFGCSLFSRGALGWPSPTNPLKKKANKSNSIPTHAAKLFNSLSFFSSPIRKSEHGKKERNWLSSGLNWFHWFKSIYQFKLLLK